MLWYCHEILAHTNLPCHIQMEQLQRTNLAVKQKIKPSYSFFLRDRISGNKIMRIYKFKYRLPNT